MPNEYECKLVITYVGVTYLIYIYHNLRCSTPLALVNTNQIQHSYTCYNYNIYFVHFAKLVDGVLGSRRAILPWCISVCVS